MLFMKQFRQVNPQMESKEIYREGAKSWKSLSEAEKESYRVKAKQQQ